MVIPRPIQGRYRTLKNYAKWSLLSVLIALPFIRFAGRPLLLLDIPARKFHIFGLSIWPQELYFLHVLLLTGGVLLFFVTALWGRVWCGYACPQTIFNELYDHIGRLVAGKAYSNKSAGPGRWAGIYAAWGLLSIALSFVYVSYFIPYESLARDLVALDLFVDGAPRAWSLAMLGLTTFSFVNAAYFRENVCRLVCPYGRFQTALLDTHSPIVSYNIPRGEPRKATGEKVGQHKGDCIDCNLCVLVCPTGIDIREGLQVGCIACGLCDDACTQVMGKFKKETLIDYRTLAQAEDASAPRRNLRPRTIAYGSMLVVLCGIFAYLLFARVPVYANVLRDRQIQNIRIPGIGFQNGYEVHVGNMSHEARRISIQVEGTGPAGRKFRIVGPEDQYALEPDAHRKIRFIVRYPEDTAPGRAVPIRFRVRDLDHPEFERTADTVFSFPG